MDTLLIPISDEDFKKAVSIRFNNIMNGFDNFINFTLNPTDIATAEDKIINLIETIFEDNNNECFIDFYINKISTEDKENLLKLLSTEDVTTLKSLLESTVHDGVFFKLTSKKLIPFLTRLNTREAFFVTFYFTKRPVTIWGNYGMKFPLFFENEEDKNHYLKLSKSNTLV